MKRLTDEQINTVRVAAELGHNHELAAMCAALLAGDNAAALAAISPSLGKGLALEICRDAVALVVDDALTCECGRRKFSRDDLERYRTECEPRRFPSSNGSDPTWAQSICWAPAAVVCVRAPLQ